MAAVERAVGAAVQRNNRAMQAADIGAENPRDLSTVAWHSALVEHYPTMRAEWDRFAASGRMPHIADVLGEDQGNDGPWRAGIVVANGRTTLLGANHFAATSAIVTATVPGLRAALWSMLDPGTEIAEHAGPNAGVLRYHLGMVCPDGAELRIGDVTVPYRERDGILFDDTAPHAAWNRASTRRVTLFCELDRPVGGLAGLGNRAIQTMLGFDPRRRGIVAAADHWYAELNADAAQVDGE